MRVLLDRRHLSGHRDARPGDDRRDPRLGPGASDRRRTGSNSRCCSESAGTSSKVWWTRATASVSIFHSAVNGSPTSCAARGKARERRLRRSRHPLRRLTGPHGFLPFRALGCRSAVADLISSKILEARTAGRMLTSFPGNFEGPEAAHVCLGDDSRGSAESMKSSYKKTPVFFFTHGSGSCSIHDDGSVRVEEAGREVPTGTQLGMRGPTSRFSPSGRREPTSHAGGAELQI